MRVPILLYHELSEGDSPVALTEDAFAWQMRWLSDHEVHVVPLRTLCALLREGADLPRRSVVLTFDDGFESVYTVAYPILTRLGFPATVFIVGAYCGQQNNWPGQPAGIPRRRLLTWEQIVEMDRAGIEIGAHSLTHPRLDGLAPDALRRETVGAKAMIEDRLEHSIALFSFPYGRHDSAVRSLVRNTYQGACTARPALVSAQTDPLAMPRIDIHYLRSPALFAALSSPLLPIYLGVRRSLRALGTAILRRPWA